MTTVKGAGMAQAATRTPETGRTRRPVTKPDSTQRTRKHAAALQAATADSTQRKPDRAAARDTASSHEPAPRTRKLVVAAQAAAADDSTHRTRKRGPAPEAATHATRRTREHEAAREAASSTASTRRTRTRALALQLPDGVEPLDREVCYRALLARDARFDGVFYTAVVSTGIFCRPICPARFPKIENCIFLPSAAAAHQMGFRPCLRCRPEIAPGLAGWRGTANTVSRAINLIAQGAFDEDGIDSLAAKLGVGARHLRRLFDRYVGAAPVAVAQAHRVLFAKQLISETRLPMAEIALAAGFQSVRRFNDAFAKTYGKPPTAMRRAPAGRSSDTTQGLTLKLGFSPPYDFSDVLEFLSHRAIPGVEVVTRDRYQRTFALGKARGRVAVRAVPGKNYLVAHIETTDVTVLSSVVTRLRHLFDLDADIAAIDAHLAQHATFRTRVKTKPGVRVPGAWDSFELAVRGVLGQQITVRAATVFAGRLVKAHGESIPQSETDPTEPHWWFPTPQALATADFTKIGLTKARSATLNALAAAVVADPALLQSADQLEETIERLCKLPGIGPWTANYIAMRGLREPDAFPAADIGVLRALAVNDKRPTPKLAAEAAELWRPWRAYATLRLWTQPQ